MILQSLTLRNFCLFKGEQTFDLSPATVRGTHKPIVLFGGINGGGKTTLLDAIQLALYGQRARCSKRGSLGYDDFLRASIHHQAGPTERAGVTLSFRYAVEGTEHLYEVRRTWGAENGRSREELRVYRDDVHDGWLSENWAQLVEELFPLDIAQLFFFDAEKIRTLAEDEASSRALEAAIKALLGLDVVERLIADSAVLQARLAKKAGNKEDQAAATALEERLLACQSEHQRLTAERAALQNTVLKAEEEQRLANERFAAAGGSHWEARQKRALRLAELDRLAKECEAELTTLAAGEFPLAMVSDLLGCVAEQDRRERAAAEATLIDTILQERDRRLVELLRESKASAKIVTAVTSHLGTDRDARRPQEAVPRRLELSETSRSLVGSLRDHTLASQRERAHSLLERLAAVQTEREELERADAATPADADVNPLLERVKETTRAHALLEDQARRLDESVETALLAFETCQAELRKHLESRADKEFAEEDTGKMLKLAGRTRDTMQEFLRRVTAQKIDRLSALITESFRFLLRKASLVERIAIDPGTFAITLYDGDARGIPKERLSEGEKQIFAVSVLWGLARASARPLPAVIDTPMARLDAAHRQHLVERYFPNASHQVVIFSTDTEVDREYYRRLQPAVARAYHLSYDERTRRTVGELGYFWKE